MAVLEVYEPALQRSIYCVDDRSQAMTIASPGVLPNRILKLLLALATRPSVAAFKVVAKKIKAAPLTCIYDSRLLRMQLETGACRPLLHLCECFSGSRFAPAEDHEVIGIPHHLVSSLRHLVVQRVKIDVRQQRA